MESTTATNILVFMHGLRASYSYTQHYNFVLARW